MHELQLAHVLRAIVLQIEVDHHVAPAAARRRAEAILDAHDDYGRVVEDGTHERRKLGARRDGQHVAHDVADAVHLARRVRPQQRLLEHANHRLERRRLRRRLHAVHLGAQRAHEGARPRAPASRVRVHGERLVLGLDRLAAQQRRHALRPQHAPQHVGARRLGRPNRVPHGVVHARERLRAGGDGGVAHADDAIEREPLPNLGLERRLELDHLDSQLLRRVARRRRQEGGLERLERRLERLDALRLLERLRRESPVSKSGLVEDVHLRRRNEAYGWSSQTRNYVLLPGSEGAIGHCASLTAAKRSRGIADQKSLFLRPCGSREVRGASVSGASWVCHISPFKNNQDCAGARTSRGKLVPYPEGSSSRLWGRFR